VVAPGRSQGTAGSSPVAVGLVLCVLMWFSVVGQSLVGVLGPVFVNDLGLSRQRLGTLTMVAFGVGAITSFRSERVRLTDGRVATSIAQCLLAVGIGVRALAPIAFWLTVAVAIIGGAGGFGNPIANVVIRKRLNGKGQITATALKQSGVQLGGFLNGIGIPALAVAIGWRWALGVWAAIPLLGALVSRVVLSGGTRVDTAAGYTVADGVPRSAENLLWPLAIYGFLMGAATSIVLAYLPLYVHERFDVVTEQAGWTVAAIGLLGAVVRIVGPHGLARLGVSTGRALILVAIGTALSTVFLAMSSALGLGLVWAGVVVYGFTGATWNVFMHLAILERAAPSELSRLTGRTQLGFYSGLAATPTFFGWIVDRTGQYATAWPVTVLFAVGAVAVGIWAAREYARGRGMSPLERT
jgi:cyanate permease